ncbi:MAG: DMT family transporter [Solirubrobacterales bacterium]
MGRRSWTLLVVLGAIWGASYLFMKVALDDMSPGMIAWTRVALASLVLVAIAGARGALRGHGSRWGMLLLLGAVQAAGPFFLIAAGQQEVPSALAGILVTAAPLWTALLAIRYDQEERSSGLRLVGVLLGFLGVVVLLGVDLGGDEKELIGGLAIVLAALGYAVGGLILKLRLSEVPPLGVATWVMVASTGLLLPAAVLSIPSEVPGVAPLLSVVALGAVGTGIAFVIFYSLIATVGPARTFIVTYLAPAFAIVYGATLLDEAITAATITGLTLILAGSWLGAEGRLPWRPRPAGRDREPALTPPEAPIRDYS